jgi:hypothetical protein
MTHGEKIYEYADPITLRAMRPTVPIPVDAVNRGMIDLWIERKPPNHEPIVDDKKKLHIQGRRRLIFAMLWCDTGLELCCTFRY